MSLRSKFKHSKVFILWFLNTDKLVKKKIVCASYFQPTCPYLEIIGRTLTCVWTLHKDVQIDSFDIKFLPLKNISVIKQVVNRGKNSLELPCVTFCDRSTFYLWPSLYCFLLDNHRGTMERTSFEKISNSMVSWEERSQQLSSSWPGCCEERDGHRNGYACEIQSTLC